MDTSEDAVRVDRLAPGDRARWQELFDGYNDFYEREVEAGLTDRLWRELGADERIHARGAWVDGELVGITHFLVHPSTSAADVCYLQDLFTAPAARGHGAGRALIASVADWARERGCSRVYWLTQATNTTARRLYDQVAVDRGFIQYQLPL